MNDELHPSVLVRLLSIGFFLVFALAALAWFALSMNDLATALSSGLSVVGFDKGSTYMLGAGIGGFIVVIGGVFQGLLRKNLTTRAKTLFARSLMFSLILMFGFPHIAHYAVNSYAEQENYQVCSDATYRWALYSKFYYTKNNLACSELVEQEDITKSSSGR
jgi:hypothetical protein